jgi:hypothetical protein
MDELYIIFPNSNCGLINRKIPLEDIIINNIITESQILFLFVKRPLMAG